MEYRGSSALATLVTQTYDLVDVTCKLMVRGLGDTYLVISSNERFIFHFYRSSHRNFALIVEEVALLLALRDSGVSVCYLIGDK
jgi:Ser/Thr protein kinase RdoA (MazF antagonist)